MNTTAKKLATKNVSPWVNNVLKIILPQTNRQPPQQRQGGAFDKPPAATGGVQLVFSMNFARK